jgi:hypothetical protein
MPDFIVVVGNLEDEVNLLMGPFQSKVDACVWAENNVVDDVWHIAELSEPEGE